MSEKKNNLSTEEAEFVEIYENTVCLHTSSIVLTLPAAFYNFQLYKASKTHPINEYRFNWAKRRTLLFVPLCFSVLFTAYWYEKSNDFAVIDPSTEEQCAVISLGNQEDTDAAVQAAFPLSSTCKMDALKKRAA